VSESTPGERVRAKRREQNLTQADLAEAVGVSRQTIISIERSEYSPSVFLALLVARRLNSTVEALWGA
jgi:putative transcriptional regulator